MKSTSKILLTLTLVLGLTLSFAACKKKASDGPCTTHTDSDGNYVCDVCKSAIEKPSSCTHKDLDDNGACDDCGADYTDGCSNHVDENDDGKCDVEGCGADYTDGCDIHVDKDDNGVCDNVGCGATYIDGCDNHMDKNNDGVCDIAGCGVIVGEGCTHVDKDDNGVCDIAGCGVQFFDGCDNHSDKNDDGICDVEGCGKEYSDGTDISDEYPGNSFDNAVVLTEGVAASHDVYTYNQKHYYKLTASATGTYDVKFSGSQFYINVYSEDSKTSPIAAWSVYIANDVTVNTVSLNAGGVYYFEIISMYEYGYPEIEVALSTGESGGTDEKPDDAGFESATVIVPNGASSTHSSAADQTTYFVFTATETLYHVIAIETDDLFPLLTIYNASKELVGTYYNVWGKIDLTFPAIQGETYYLVITMQMYEGSFTLTFSTSDTPVCLEHVFTNSCDKTCNNEGCDGIQTPQHVYDNDCDTTCNNEGCESPIRTVFGHTDTNGDGKCDSCGVTVSSGDSPSAPKFDTAVTLVPGTKYSLQFDDSNIAYYYIYTAKEDGEHNIKINAGLDYPCLKIYDANQNLILGPEYGEFGAIDIDQAMKAGESYYIVVSVIFAPASLEFTFSTPKADTPDDSTVAAGGTSFADAITITPGTKYSVALDKVGKKVYFKFTATSTEAYHVYVSGNKNAMLQVWRDEENTHQSPVYANWGTGLIDTDLATFTEGETYYIVLSVSGRATLEFIFTDVN